MHERLRKQETPAEDNRPEAEVTTSFSGTRKPPGRTTIPYQARNGLRRPASLRKHVFHNGDGVAFIQKLRQLNLHVGVAAVNKRANQTNQCKSKGTSSETIGERIRPNYSSLLSENECRCRKEIYLATKYTVVKNTLYGCYKTLSYIHTVQL